MTRRMTRWMSFALVLCTSGCFSVADLDRYSFDVDPCPPAPPECSGGARYAYVQTTIDIARPREDGTLNGFDIDGTDRVVCGHDDTTAPNGLTGIDNEATALVISAERFSGTMFTTAFDEGRQSGEQLSIYVLDHVDDFQNDDCVSVQFLPGQVPMGEEPRTYLDADGDGQLDRNLRLDFGGVTSDDQTACIVDGELRVRIDEPQTLLLDPNAPPAIVNRARLRCEAAAEELTECVFGGAFTVSSLSDPTLGPVLRASADIDFDGRQCQSVSFALELEAIAAELGEARP